jgi:hypothetical protein
MFLYVPLDIYIYIYIYIHIPRALSTPVGHYGCTTSPSSILNISIYLLSYQSLPFTLLFLLRIVNNRLLHNLSSYYPLLEMLLTLRYNYSLCAHGIEHCLVKPSHGISVSPDVSKVKSSLVMVWYNAGSIQ